jgi:hypothetical protein
MRNLHEPQKAHINTDLFARWFKAIFVPRMTPGTNIIVLDVHASRCISPELLQFAKESAVIFFILPSYTTVALQPLDRVILAHSKHFLKKILTAASTPIKIEKWQGCN